MSRIRKAPRRYLAGFRESRAKGETVALAVRYGLFLARSIGRAGG